MRAPSITIAHGVCDATGSHTKSFSSLRYDMPWPIYAGTMLHDWCEANGFSKYEKAVAAYCDDLDDVADLEISDIVSITESTNMPHVKKRKFENAVEVVKRNRMSGAPLSAIQARRWMLYVLSRHRDWSVWIMCVRHPLKNSEKQDHTNREHRHERHSEWHSPRPPPRTECAHAHATRAGTRAAPRTSSVRRRHLLLPLQKMHSCPTRTTSPRWRSSPRLQRAAAAAARRPRPARRRRPARAAVTRRARAPAFRRRARSTRRVRAIHLSR